MLAHIHTRAHARAHMHTRTHAHTHTYIHTDACMHTHARTHAGRQAGTHSRKRVNPKTIQLYFPHIDLTVHSSYHCTEGINE